jgi:4-hydroxymandelate oxidase
MICRGGRPAKDETPEEEKMKEPLNLEELEALARETLAGSAYDYYASGADDELTLSDNRAAFRRWQLHYRVLVDVSERDLGTTVLGERLTVPYVGAPTAFHKLAHPRGEAATAAALGAAGTAMILSTLSTTPVEEVVAATPGPVWFQLYVYKDRGATAALVERARAAGCRALVLTVDAPLLGRRERDVRNRFRLPEGLRVENVLPAGQRLPAEVADSGLAAYFASLLDPSLSWKDLEWLRTVSGLPVVIKGIVRADDARRAVDHGAAGVVVSNHGGRQLDTAPATIDVLAEVVDAAGDQLEVLMDGGVRRGTDVIKALALGAKAVLLGRPLLWALAWNGEEGVRHALTLLREEVDLALALCGSPTLAALDRSLVRRVHQPDR